MELGAERVSGSTDGPFIILNTVGQRLVNQVAEIVELVEDNAVILLAVALADLVENTGQILQTGQHLIGGTDVRIRFAVGNVHARIAKLADTGEHRALADARLVLRTVFIRRRGNQADLVKTLARVAVCVDIGNVVARHVQALLGGVNAETDSGNRSKCTAHGSGPPYALKSVRSPFPRAGGAD